MHVGQEFKVFQTDELRLVRERHPEVSGGTILNLKEE